MLHQFRSPPINFNNVHDREINRLAREFDRARHRFASPMGFEVASTIARGSCDRARARAISEVDLDWAN